MDTSGSQRFDWDWIEDLPSHTYLAPAALRWVEKHQPTRILDLGCGDGRLTAQLARFGGQTVGMDFSQRGISRAAAAYPEAMFAVQQLDEPLPDAHRHRYDLVTAIEVIEHMLLPRHLFRRAAEALTPDGRLLITTPYHGYWKNLALSIANKWDHHHTVMWDYGHVKFFSPKTLTAMAAEQGFTLEALQRVGRIPIVAASMVAIFGGDRT